MVEILIIIFFSHQGAAAAPVPAPHAPSAAHGAALRRALLPEGAPTAQGPHQRAGHAPGPQCEAGGLFDSRRQVLGTIFWKF